MPNYYEIIVWPHRVVPTLRWVFVSIHLFFFLLFFSSSLLHSLHPVIAPYLHDGEEKKQEEETPLEIWYNYSLSVCVWRKRAWNTQKKQINLIVVSIAANSIRRFVFVCLSILIHLFNAISVDWVTIGSTYMDSASRTCLGRGDNRCRRESER